MTWSKMRSSFLWPAPEPRDPDRLASVAFGAVASGAVLLLALVLLFLAREAAPVLGSASLASSRWEPSGGHFGIAAMALGSLLAMMGALVLAIPLGLGTAIHIRFQASPAVRAVLQPALALLAGVPSVVFGLWGLTQLVPLIAQVQAPGASLLAAMGVLALMVVPTVALTSLAALDAVPAPWLQGAAALGLSRRAVITGVALPAARGGIRSGIALAAARALGETMAVLMVADNVVQWPGSVFDPVRVVTANIALEMAYAVDHHRAALFASGLVLAGAVLVLTWAATPRRVQGP